MQNSAVIRPFRQEDLGAVMEIWLAANLQAHSFVPAAYWRAHYAEAAEGIAGAEVYVCEEDGRLLGFAGLTGDYLAGIFVRPGEQSRGVGKRLLDRAKVFHLRGSISYPSLSFPHRTMMKLLYQSLRGAPPEKQTSENRALMETYGKQVDFTDFSALDPIIQEIQWDAV